MKISIDYLEDVYEDDYEEDADVQRDNHVQKIKRYDKKIRDALDYWTLLIIRLATTGRLANRPHDRDRKNTVNIATRSSFPSFLPSGVIE